MKGWLAARESVTLRDTLRARGDWRPGRKAMAAMWEAAKKPGEDYCGSVVLSDHPAAHGPIARGLPARCATLAARVSTAPTLLPGWPEH